MLKRLRGELPAPYPPDTRFSVASRNFFPPPSPIRLPKIKDIPIQVCPDMLTVAPSALEEWARILLHIDPKSRLRWKAGSSFNGVASDILISLANAIDSYAPKSGLRADGVYFSLEEGGFLKLSLYAFTDTDLPLIYTEMIRKVRDETPRLFPLIKEALCVLGRVSKTWEDLKLEAEDQFDAMWGWDGEEEDECWREQKERLQRVKKIGPKKSPFRKDMDLKDHIALLKTRVQKFKPLDGEEKRLLTWVEEVVSFAGADRNLKCSNEEQFDGHIDSGHFMPILYERGDELSEYYAEDINDHYNGGVFVGENLVYELGSQMHKEFGSVAYMDMFLADVRLLGLRQRVFGFS